MGFLLPFAALFPRVITDYLFAFMGGGHGMDGFKGRGKEWNRSWRLEKREKEEEEVVVTKENTVIFCNGVCWNCRKILKCFFGSLRGLLLLFV